MFWTIIYFSFHYILNVISPKITVYQKHYIYLSDVPTDYKDQLNVMMWNDAVVLLLLQDVFAKILPN